MSSLAHSCSPADIYCIDIDHARRARQVDGAARHAVQGVDPSTVQVRSWVDMGRYYGADQGADPRHAPASVDASATGNVQSEQVCARRRWIDTNNPLTVVSGN